MQIICITRGSYSFGSNLAEQLAGKLGYACISREMLTDKATKSGIPVGKLEIETLKNKPLSEQMSIDIEMFKAFITRELCETANEKGVIYHGRTGHLVLPGLANVLRVRAITDPETRIRYAMERLSLERKQAKNYIEQTDDDIRRWTRNLFNVNSDDPALYDVTINAAHMSSESASDTLAEMTKLPEFQPNAATNRTMADLLLAARCRLALGRNALTSKLAVTVKAMDGHVTVTYLPRQAMHAGDITRLLESMSEVKSFVCTVASTNILCVGEKFNPDDEYIDHLIDVAEKWNAAVEIVRLPPDEEAGAETPVRSDAPAASSDNYNGGILDETDGLEEETDSGVKAVMNKLIQVGRAGCSHTTYGGISGLIADLSKTRDYSLIVVGNVFASKGAAQQRLKRDAVSMLGDKFRAPVLTAEDLKSEYLFGKKQLVGLIGFAAVSLLVYLAVFTNQDAIIRFIASGQLDAGLHKKIAASVTVFTFVPVVAFILGGFYHNLLKLIRLE